MSLIADALFSRPTRIVLSRLFLHPEGLHLRALTAATGLGSASAQRELGRLAAAGVLMKEHIGKTIRYKANPASPIHEELAAILRKTAGTDEVISSALAPFRDKLDRALIYGSVARRQDHAASDIDVLIVSDELGSAELFPAMLEAEAALGRKISMTIYQRNEFARKQKAGNYFIKEVLAGPTIDLLD